MVSLVFFWLKALLEGHFRKCGELISKNIWKEALAAYLCNPLLEKRGCSLRVK
jgi:hypothetical protein